MRCPPTHCCFTVATAFLTAAMLLGLASSPGVPFAASVDGRLQPERDAVSGLHRSPHPDPVERLRILTEGKGQSHDYAGRAGSSARVLDDPRADYDLRHVRLEIDLTAYTSETIAGVATQVVESRIDGLTEVAFDLLNTHEVDEAAVDGAPALFVQANDRVSILLPEPLDRGETAEIRIAYHGQPPGGGYGMRIQFRLQTPFIWTLSQPSYGHFWWPCKDLPEDKADSSDVLITVPTDEFELVATSNGLLRSVEETRPGTRTYWWHNSYPIAPYLISVTAGEFVRIEDGYPLPGGETMLVEHFVFPDLEAQAREDFSIKGEAIDAFAERFCPYPFAREKYGNTLFGWAGAMEHQTNTSYGYYLVRGDHYFDWIYVHELAHMWWGDDVTCATWADTWLNEGFASWGEAVWQEHLEGFDAYRDYMVQVQTVLDPSGPLYGFDPPFDGNTIYNKGSWAIHMLRGVLGDEAFYRAVADYRALYTARTVTTDQFREVMERSSGVDLGAFFDAWVYGTDRPHYRLAVDLDQNASPPRLYLHLEQTQPGATRFRMPVTIRTWHPAPGGPDAQFTRDHRFWNDDDHDDLVIELPLEASVVDSVAVDPDHWILRTVDSGNYGFYIVSDDLAPALADSAVAVVLAARGGTPPYVWEYVDPPPPGVTLRSETGVLSGRPVAAGEYAFRVRCSDRGVPRRSDTQRLFWKITAPGDSSTAEIPAYAGVRALPNPAPRSVLLSFQGGGNAPVSWRVYAVTGREVARGESTRPNEAGEHAWVWSGRDAQGEQVPNGVYLVRAHMQGGTGATLATGRVVILRDR